VLPLPQRCTTLAHEEATLPLSLLPLRGCLHCDCRRHLRHRRQLCCHCRRCCPSPSPSAICHCGLHRSLQLLSLLRCCQPSPLPLPSLSAIAISVTIGHRSCHLRWASPLPLPLAISESCCLGAARIVFNHLKQRRKNCPKTITQCFVPSVDLRHDCIYKPIGVN
jgi:hypothetical protein